MNPQRRPNRLLQEKSPYLLQHAYNPVDWYPWGDEAFNRARAEDKPVLLSVGYSTCHWCHVMERESFENDAIAALMNESFVCVKVDREELPDVDRVYMTALQAIGQNGGWPMTMFLTPGREPFYGGTYFPPESRYGRAGFPDLLNRISTIWADERGKVNESANDIIRFLREAASSAGAAGDPGAELLERCFQQLQQTFDPEFGGFGSHPKFPRPVVFEFLLRYANRVKSAEPVAMCELTLTKMAAGGMHDQIGGGFHRYSVDGEWRVPHFEKMLYDQAQLTHAFLDLYQATGNLFYGNIARDVLEYVLRDMSGPEGGFTAGEDADSAEEEGDEKKEGAFYVWTRDEIDRVLGTDARLCALYFGVENDGNALSDPQQEFLGKNILFTPESLADAARVSERSLHEFTFAIAEIKRRLLDVRSLRPRPQRDDKIITAWNGLMIGAFARAGSILQSDRYLEAAGRAARFLFEHLYNSETQSLRRRYREGESRFDGQLDDYAFLTRGLIDLYQSTGEAGWLSWACTLADSSVRFFEDEARGGFYDAPEGTQGLPVRLREHYDGAEPTGNAVSAMNFLRLAALTGKAGFRMMAEKTIRAFVSTMEKHPVVMPYMVSALDQMLTPYQQIVIVGSPGHPSTIALKREVSTRYLPHAAVHLIGSDEARVALRDIAPFAADLPMLGGAPTAYLCKDFACSLPVTDAGALSISLPDFRTLDNGTVN